MAFTVAIAGRPNVGKSTLFNWLVGKQLALVHDTPGLTRDWREADASIDDLNFKVIDTAGLEESFDESIQGRMRKQTEMALARADLVLLVVDARSGITPMDRHFAEFLRKQKMKTALVINKCESEKAMGNRFEAFELGLGEPIPVSAVHGQGIEGLYNLLKPYVEAAGGLTQYEEEDDLEKLFEKYTEGGGTGFGDEPAPEEEPEHAIKIAIVGRPNAGKSTLLNALVGEHRSMVGPEAGITRDAVHVDWEFKGQKLRLVDTAGLRKRARVIDEIEQMSAADAMRAIRLAQVVILVIDAEKMFEHQDLHIAGHVIEEGRALVVAVNKWDLIEDKAAQLEEIQYQADKSLSQVNGVPLVTISALNESRTDKVLEAALETYRRWNSRVSTGQLNRWLRLMEQHNPPPLANGRPNRLRYMTQIKARPPTFALWVSRPQDYPETHKRYLINNLRRDFDIPSVPVRFIVKASKNPYAD